MAIIGNQNPIVGITYDYEISESFNVNDMLVSDIQYVWHLHKKIDGAWMNVTKDKGKIGKKVQYVFYEKVLGIPFRLEVYKAVKNILSSEYEATKLASLEVIPSSASSPKINRVVLFNRGAKDPNKASYQDTLIAQAQCVAMFNKEIEFQLWEDDAAGEGHDKNINKNNTTNLKFNARVNENGIAEVRIPLSSNQNVLKAIANRYLMQGDQNEGTNHEYYVTASYAGQIKANQVNVNVANPDHGQKPKNDSFIGSGTSSRPPRHDGIGKIKDAYFVNSKNQKLSKAGIGNFVIVKILTENMKGKVVTLKIWEEDNGFDDLVFEKNIRLNEAESYYRVDITKSVFDKGYGTDRTIFGSPVDSDSVQQTYYIEIIPLDDSVDSKSFGLTSEGLMKVDVAKSPAVVKEQVQQTSNCGEKYCIKLGDKNELVREINIRLAGFGGNVPTDEFTERTEKMVKQFQKDYMKVPETGKVCGNTLRAIDEFQNKFTIDFTEIKCKCGKCTGFGDGSNKGKYLSGNTEARHKYEYPGIHRSLLSSLRSVKFYLSKDGRYSFNKVSSGYRCRFHAEYLKRPTTNHMGKALDLHFNDKNGRTRKNSDIEIIRKDIFNKYLGAKWDWKTGQDNIFNLESTAIGATTWVHYDVREFDSEYLKDHFFVKDIAKLNGKSIVSLALELGFTNTCSCLGGGSSKATERDTTKKDNKNKWSHSEFGNLIARRESSDDYNKCNQTKGGLKVIDNVNVVGLTISEIQQKQKDRDIFAVGRYQLIPNTLNSAITSLGLDTNQKLDEEMQDKIFDEYLIKVKRPKIIAFLEKDGTVEDAMYASSMEWASIGVEKGRRISDKVIKNKNKEVVSRIVRYAEGGESYYAGDGLNKAHITPEQIKNVLINSKNANK